MIVEPKIRNNVCYTAHPVGCRVQVRRQIDYVRARPAPQGVRRALVVGSSNGYGLAARIVAAFGAGAGTLGVSFERPGSEGKAGSAGWYNEAAFQEEARGAGLPAWSMNGDAFSPEVKEQALELLRAELGPLDLLVYSIAAPRRQDPATGELHTSVIKPIGAPYRARTLDFASGQIRQVSAEPATPEEIAGTVKVMGGEDWALWVQTLLEAGLLARGATTVAFSYVGPEITFPIYRDGTIGRAKEDLEATALRLNELLAEVGGRAVVSVNKALVTRASAVIPGVPLYISLLYRVMKRKGIHENCIHQMHRLYSGHLYAQEPLRLDGKGRIRLDDQEMREDVQREVAEHWERVDAENLEQLADIEGFRSEFLQHHGFGVEGVDYGADVEV